MDRLQLVKPLPPEAYISEEGYIVIGNEAWLPDEWETAQPIEIARAIASEPPTSDTPDGNW